MTRDSIASFVTNKLGITDSTSVTRCNESIQQRFQMIYDMELWKDTLRLVTGLTVDTTGVFSFPASIDRIISVRSTGDTLMSQADAPFLMQFDPTIFERTGTTPLAFDEFLDTTDSFNKKLRVWPIPNAASSPVAIILVGKMTCPTLAGSDSPSTYLRSIDNCLIAYVTGDMLDRMRQAGKSQLKFQEAAALVEIMRNLENRQSARQPVILPDIEPIQQMGTFSDNWFMAKG